MVSAAMIAAEVALRYGVAVCPSVVQMCPPRTFGATLPVWDGRKLVYPDEADRKALRRKAMWAGATSARRAARDPVVVARRAEVALLHQQGLSVRPIAEKMGVSYDTALKDHRICGLVPNAYVTAAMTQAAVRAERIAQLHGEGWTVEAIAKLLGIVGDTVRDLAWKQHGLKFARKVANTNKPHPIAGPRPVRKNDPANPAWQPVAQMRAGGASIEDVMRAFGLTRATVYRYIRQGAGLAPRRLTDLHSEIEKRKAELAVLIGRGVSMTKIAQMWGIHPRQVSRYRAALGIDAVAPGKPKAAVAA